MKLRHGRYDEPWVVAMRKDPGASLCVDDECALSGGRAHVGPCESCTCGDEHAIEECPEHRTKVCSTCKGAGRVPRLSPTKTSAEARRLVRTDLRARTLAFLNSEEREDEAGGDHVSAMLHMLESVWDDAFEAALALPCEHEQRPEPAPR